MQTIGRARGGVTGVDANAREIGAVAGLHLEADRIVERRAGAQGLRSGVIADTVGLMLIRRADGMFALCEQARLGNCVAGWRNCSSHAARRSAVTGASVLPSF